MTAQQKNSSAPHLTMRQKAIITDKKAVQLLKKRKVLSLIIGAFSTIAGLTLLVLAGLLGSNMADFCLELGVAISLSGALWWIGSRIRGEWLERPDYSALLIVGLVGAAVIAWGIKSGAMTHTVLLTMGAAVTTVWLFSALDHQFVLKHDPYEMPMWAEILTAPLIPLWWLTFRNFWSQPQPTKRVDVLSHVDEMEIARQLGSLVVGNTAEDVADRLGARLPDDLISWISQSGGSRATLAGGSVFSVWPWQGMWSSPIEAPDGVLIFADNRMEGAAQEVFALDLRPGPLTGVVVQAWVQWSGTSWYLAEPFRVVASNVTQWRQYALQAPEAPAGDA
jgi:hypothetical protein